MFQEGKILFVQYFLKYLGETTGLMYIRIVAVGQAALS